jgi:hypothetical protein
MDVDRRLEHLCERITLVKGVGSRRRGELCVMSFVALLAGEPHTDHPASASPLIRNLAILVNDAMPEEARQRLKPFAARIVGTNDGCDRDRVEVLRQSLAMEILPRIRRDMEAGLSAERCRAPLEYLLAGIYGFAGSVGRDSETRIALLLTRLERGVPPGDEHVVGSAAGEVLARCMQEAATHGQRTWYWDEAISLLDRLCDIGVKPPRQAIRDDRITLAEGRIGGALPANTWLNSIRRLLPAT